MKIFWRLKKADYYFTAIELKKRIPELKGLNADTITDNLRGSNLEFFYKEKVETNVLIRLTLPFALIIGLILFIFSPINYMITGHWGYKTKWLTNWFKALGL